MEEHIAQHKGIGASVVVQTVTVEVVVDVVVVVKVVVVVQIDGPVAFLSNQYSLLLQNDIFFGTS